MNLSESTRRISVSPFSADRDGQAQVALQIEIPADDALGVLAHQRLLAGGNLQLVEIVPGLVAVVQADVDDVRIVLGHVVQAAPERL